jgi:hypothetical protein
MTCPICPERLAPERGVEAARGVTNGGNLRWLVPSEEIDASRSILGGATDKCPRSVLRETVAGLEAGAPAGALLVRVER